jgi:hypothetical protein
MGPFFPFATTADNLTYTKKYYTKNCLTFCKSNFETQLFGFCCTLTRLVESSHDVCFSHYVCHVSFFNNTIGFYQTFSYIFISLHSCFFHDLIIVYHCNSKKMRDKYKRGFHNKNRTELKCYFLKLWVFLTAYQIDSLKKPIEL